MHQKQYSQEWLGVLSWITHIFKIKSLVLCIFFLALMFTYRDANTLFKANHND
jgi:hypothetical protein